MLLVLILGIAAGVITPVLRHYGRAAAAVLAIAAATLLAPSVADLVRPDARIGLAAIQSNRRFDLMIIACELPVLALALISMKRFSKLYWVGYGLHAALTAWLGVVIIWLEFFWHW
jgi:hypothetical protein